MNDLPNRDVVIFTGACQSARQRTRCLFGLRLWRRCEVAPTGGSLVAEPTIRSEIFWNNLLREAQWMPNQESLLGRRPGDRVGRYKLLQQIGEGGCGVVYMAEQEQPVRRRVALKIIKPGMDTKGVIARFEAERQALAMMDHPSINKIFDAGATESGRPYFVMELVRGTQSQNTAISIR